MKTFPKCDPCLSISFYKITKIVRALWLAEGRVCMRFCKDGFDVEMFCFSRVHQASTNSISLYFIYPILRRLKLGKSLQTSCDNFFRLSWHFKREKSVCWKSSFVQNKNWSRVQDSVCKTLRLVRISLLISAITKSFAFFFSRKSCYNCLEFSQPLEYLYQAMQTPKSFLLLKWYNFYSFKIFPRFWLAKSTRIIHHNQPLMTKFGRMLRLINRWRQTCSFLAG